MNQLGCKHLHHSDRAKLHQKQHPQQIGELKITKCGPGQAHRYFYLTALRWLYRDRVIGAWYRNKIKRDGNRNGKAIVAIMCKLMLALGYVAKSARVTDMPSLPELIGQYHIPSNFNYS